MRHSKGISRRSFLVGSAAAGAVGAWALWRYRHGLLGRPRFSVRAWTLDELPAAEFDVCIVGSGPAGCTLAGDLATRGKRVLMVESAYGPDRESPPLSAALDKYVSYGPEAYPVAGSRIRALGGTSTVWTGRCPRLLPADFGASPYARAAGGWPVSYADLEPYYRRAEDSLQVVHRAAQPGEGAGAEPYPPTAFSELLARHGIIAAPPPVSSDPQGEGGPLRYGPGRLPGLTDMPEVQLVDGATVTAVRAGPDGSVTGLVARTLEGGERVLRADRYVLAGGTLESVRLLALARGDAHPAGLGNAGGWLGDGFGEHPWIRIEGRVPGLGESESWLLYRTSQYCEAMHQAGLGGTLFGLYHIPGAPGRVRLALSIEMEPARENHLRLAPELEDAFGNPGLGVALGFTEWDRRSFDRAEEMMLDLAGRIGVGSLEKEAGVSWSHHHVGGCRMSRDPASGVLDPDLRVHGTDNLFVLSTGAFVTGGVANPTLTLVALGHRLADRLTGTPPPA